MTHRSQSPPVPARVIDEFELDEQTLEFVAAGHINRTWMAGRRDGRRTVLQRVNPIFPAEVNRDIDAATRHLESRGLVTPRLIPTRGGQLWVEHEGEVWRLQTYVPGVAHERVVSQYMAREAGRLLGSFHAALADLDYEPESKRLGVHDLERHLTALDEALRAHGGHRAHSAVRALARQIFELSTHVSELPATPSRLVHGDPKISNLLFDAESGAGVCLIDLDTLARMRVTLELGDAFRSWCNTSAEDSDSARFSLPLFESAIDGYADSAGGLLDAEERRAIPDATLRIAVVLAARFCADALNESYFGWDRERFASSSAHNLARTESQLALARSLEHSREAMREIIERVMEHG